MAIFPKSLHFIDLLLSTAGLVDDSIGIDSCSGSSHVPLILLSHTQLNQQKFDFHLLLLLFILIHFATF